MFTGLVQQLAGVVELISAAPGMRLVIGVRSDVSETKDPITDASLPGAALLAGAAVGDSIAINGCCLTVVGVEDGRVSFDAGPETLSAPTWANWSPGVWSISKHRLAWAIRSAGIWSPAISMG